MQNAKSFDEANLPCLKESLEMENSRSRNCLTSEMKSKINCLYKVNMMLNPK